MIAEKIKTALAAWQTARWAHRQSRRVMRHVRQATRDARTHRRALKWARLIKPRGRQ